MRAADQIRRASTWWQNNRPLAPSAFAEDLGRAFEVIALQPGIGARATNAHDAEIRRILLSRTGYLLYYQPVVATRSVLILALWHARRGREPRL